jgi:tetratricopeptide (TPR) repeat protein
LGWKNRKPREPLRRKSAIGGWLLAAWMLAFGAAWSPAQAPKEIERLWRSNTTYASAPPPLAFDIDVDGQLEIIQVGGKGEISAMDPVGGRFNWRTDLGDETLLSPVAGHFFGENRFNILVATRGTRCFILDGPTGRIERGFDLTFISEMPPTVFPWTETVTPESSFREGLLFYDLPQNRLQWMLLNREFEEPLGEYALRGGSLASPPAIGHTGLDARGPHAVCVSTNGWLTILPLRQPNRTVVQQLENQAQSARGATLADLDADGNSEIVVTDRSGYLHVLTFRENRLVPFYQGLNRAGALEPKESLAILSEPLFPPVAIDVNGDGCDDLLIPREKGFGLYDGRTSQPLWSPPGATVPLQYTHGLNVLSPPAVFHGDGRAMAVFCDEQNVVLLDLVGREQIASFGLGRGAVATPLVGSLLNDGMTQIFVRTETEGRCELLSPGLSWNAANPPWSGERGGPWRSCRIDRQVQQFRAAQLEQLSRTVETNLARAKKLADEGEWAQALAVVDGQVLAASPYHHEALVLRQYYFLRAHLPVIVLGAFLTLLIAGVILWYVFRYTRAAVQTALARRALQHDRPERAIHFMKKLCRDFPKNRKYASRLAKIYIKQKIFNEESAFAFERAHRFFPTEENYIKALATAYSSGPRYDEQAAAVYNVMARMTRKPGPWYFLLGQTLQRINRPREALDAYRLAIVHQYEDPRLPGCMTDLYIQLGITTPEILPTLERVLEERRDDSAFLRTYCQACQEARRYDDQSQQVALSLLEHDPEAPAGHTILATRLLQSGRHKDAMKHAQAILQVRPNDSIGLRLLGACYAAERRLDETAMKIFAKALEANPDAPEILIAVSHGFIQQERADPDARDVYQKALAHYPQDETVLAQLALIAEKEQDDELTIRTIEPLLSMGRRTRELVLQLANAYCRLGITADKALEIYREALVFQPDHATIQDNLAAIFLRQQKADGEAMQVFEAVHERFPERMDVGLQLLRCYNATDMTEKAQALGERLRGIDPNNSDLQKLMAAVSEKADQMESAISGYEQVLAGQPDDTDAVCALGSLYGRKRRSDNAAIEIYLKAIQIEPTRVEAYLAAARAYAVRETWDHSIQMIKNMLTRCPGQINQAIALLESLAETWPKQLTLRWYLVDTLIFNSRLREARSHVVEIQKIDPAQAEASLRALDRIVEKNPKDALAHLERGRILAKLEREREARQALEQAHRFHPENDEICRELLGFYQRQLDKQESAEMRFQLGRLAMRLDKYDLAISCFQTTSRDYRWEGESVRNLARCFMAKGMLDLSMQELKRLPMEDDVKELLYDLGQRYEAVGDVQGAREVYKIIFAADITFRDVKGKLETLSEDQPDAMAAERTAIIQSLSEDASKRYDLLEELGRGAMGIVYKARDQELEEVVALKILPDSLMRNQEAVRRFRQEARSARRLSHPNVVRIHDIGEEMGRKYISMEFVEGTDLKRKLRACNRELPFPDALRYCLQISEAMAYAHSIGIVHRDIKPANLMLTKDDLIKVTDFGIAKMVEQTASPDATQMGAIIGTPLYMSPEQVKGEAVDHRADIYSMGIVFHELAGGYPPFTEGDLSYQHLYVDPKPLTNVPEAFAEIVMKCLAKKPEDRWQSANEVLDALRKISAA